MQRLENSLHILDQLVAFDTTSHRSNLDLIDWIKCYLERYDVKSTLIADATGDKQSIMATIGDASCDGIVLSGHTDVVPAERTQWSHDPFKLRIADGKAFGRGTTDMKGFLSIALAAVPAMARRSLSRPITLAFTYDEEVGCLGAPDLVEALKPGQRVIVGEPTNLSPGVRHKGGRLQCLHVRGVPAHSGTPDLGVNAILHAGKALKELAALDKGFVANEHGEASTVAVTKIAGGGAANIVPANCTVSWMLRTISKDDRDETDAHLAKLISEIDDTLKQHDPRAGAWLETEYDVPAFARSAVDPVFRRLTRDRAPIGLTFGTEAGFFSDAGHDVIVCGPGDMAQGHTDDEFIEVSALADGCRFIEDLIDEACL